MGKLVVNGAQIQCTFGAAPSSLVVVTPSPTVTKLSAATKMDHVPNTNIPPFGMCNSLQNPAVASATSAALGVLTPQPCVPVTTSPWVPGAVKVTLKKKAALVDNCKLNCNWGGVISITNPGQQKVEGK